MVVSGKQSKFVFSVKKTPVENKKKYIGLKPPLKKGENKPENKPKNKSTKVTLKCKNFGIIV